MRSIPAKFLLPLALLGLLYASVLHYRSYSVSRRYCQELTDRQAAVALEFNLAIREYVAEQIRPVVASLVGKDGFIPEAMSTSFVSRGVFEKVRKKFPDVIIKFSSDNPRNPVNLASADELKIIDYFNAHPDIDRMNALVNVNGVRYQGYFNAKRMEKGCLRCHGEPSDAPASLLTRYGDKAGFHRPLGKIVAMDTVAIPVDHINAALASEARGQWLFAATGLVLLLGGIWTIFRFTISRRLASMSEHFRSIAYQSDSALIKPVPIGGRDEIADLATSFNILAERVQATYATLDERVAERTAALAQANEELKREIAERLRAEEQLQTAKTAAEAATRAKSAFLANMSHEIRTPMTAILGYTELTAESMSGCPKCPMHSTCEKVRENRRHLTTIHRNGEYLLDLINDILDLSRVESGKMTIEHVPCSPAAVVEDVAVLMRVRAEEKGLAFATEYLGPIPETIHSDPGRLRQILVNIVGNAVKFTEQGEVRLIVQCPGDAAELALQFDVVDTGIGMTPEQAGRLFMPFVQGDASTSRRFGGSGLGLAIARSLAQMIGGDISVVRTQPNAGTQFRLTVPAGSLEGVRMMTAAATVPSASPAKASGSAAPGAGLLEGVKVLLAEDGPDNRRLIVHILKAAGAHVVPVDNGQAAVEAVAEASADGSAFDAILMDMQMPVMDGYEATRTLRRRGYEGVIIALTAHAMEGDRIKCVDAGCDGYATKPIDRRKLVTLIAGHLRLPRAAAVGTAVPV